MCVTIELSDESDRHCFAVGLDITWCAGVTWHEILCDLGGKRCGIDALGNWKSTVQHLSLGSLMFYCSVKRGILLKPDECS